MAENKAISKEFRNEQIAEFGSMSMHWYQPSNSSRSILYTKGMHVVNQHQLANQTEQIHPFIELYFLLPSHWDFAKENQKWPIKVLERMMKAQVHQSVWFGPGDTLTAHPKTLLNDEVIDSQNAIGQNINPDPINTIFKQNYFILTEPMAAEALLSAVTNVDESINWLAVMPIYQKEFEYKTSRSALELIMKFEKNNVTELVDEHRPLAAKKKFFGLF